MPDYAPNYTARAKITYSVFGTTHSQTWRHAGPGGGTELGVLLADVQQYYDAIGPQMMDDWAILSVSYAMQDSDIFLPATYSLTATGEIATVLGQRSVKALCTSFVGRSTGGHRAVLYQYGMYWTPGDVDDIAADFRVNAADLPAVADAVGALNGTLGLVANDGNAVAWYPYCNVKYNDYWERRLRTGG